jgi:ubiquilin
VYPEDHDLSLFIAIMSEDASASDDAPLTFNVKSSGNAKYTLTLPSSTTIASLKETLAGEEYANHSPELQRLIYSGRVLKDADTLGSYKIKDGNTIHLVKSAASNQAQNPANAGAGSSTGAPTSSAGVPQGMAAGTGNNPLAGLTGARYAGLAQLPGAGMFGADGGVRGPFIHVLTLSQLEANISPHRWVPPQTQNK